MNSTTTPDQSQIDRAHESVTTAHPDADGAEYDALLAVAIADIVAIDAAADAAESFNA